MSTPPVEGTRDIGPYRLAQRIAVGGMAEVYRALSPQVAGGDRSVVIKRMLPTLIADSEQRAMFEQEVQLGEQLDHPNVVQVLGHGMDADAPYIVLEYVFGVDLWRLGRWMAQRGKRMRTAVALRIGIQLLAGLEAVHQLKDASGRLLRIMHQDVSPSNVFLSVHGDVKLGDLGIAKAAMMDQARPATNSRIKGKLGYLSPELVAGTHLDQRGDIFAASVVIAELLMGKPLFAGGTEIGVLLAIRDGDLKVFKATFPLLPPGLGDTLLEGLAKDPTDRVNKVGALRDALLPFLTEDAHAIDRELGGLVVGAMDAQGRDARSSLALTLERDGKFFEALTPAMESTPPPPLIEYWVERPGEERRCYSLGQLVQALTTFEVEATDQVRLGDGPARVIANVSELACYLPPSTRTPNARRRTRMAETNEVYNLGGRNMLGVMASLLLGQDTGLLLCQRGQVRKEIYLESGVPDFVTSNQTTELLGETLVADDLITREELDMSLAMMPRFEGRLGETLIGLELIEPMALFRHMTQKLHEKLMQLFLWDSGIASLYRGVRRPERGFPLGIDPWGLLESGARLRNEAGLDRALLEGEGALFRRRVMPPALELPSAVEAIWVACEAPRSLIELEGLDNDKARARALVTVLLSAGLLQWKPIQ